MAKLSAELLLQRETRISYGPVPDRLLDRRLDPMNWQMRPGEFLLRGEGDHYFYYRPGAGITIHRGAGADVARSRSGSTAASMPPLPA